ncbi:RYP2-like protein [Purpureocillium lavendulum]|uniref:RYP2-like protein n=1 Tax=Purpureocillium lavendulum TaxID=1247861 RepID=A0AB34FAN8_9HYPO|nr:RYP2-like protein [Purpureocillium lavendulum]
MRGTGNPIPLELLLLSAEHLAPLDLLALLRATPGLSRLLTLRHVTRTDASGRSILHHLAEEAEEPLMRLILANKSIAPNPKDCERRTPFWSAAGSGHEAVVKLLLGRQDVVADSRDSYGDTPLSYAAECGHEAVVELLLDRKDVGADFEDSSGGATLSRPVS